MAILSSYRVRYPLGVTQGQEEILSWVECGPYRTLVMLSPCCGAARHSELSLHTRKSWHMRTHILRTNLLFETVAPMSACWTIGTLEEITPGSTFRPEALTLRKSQSARIACPALVILQAITCSIGRRKDIGKVGARPKRTMRSGRTSGVPSQRENSGRIDGTSIGWLICAFLIPSAVA